MVNLKVEDLIQVAEKFQEVLADKDLSYETNKQMHKGLTEFITYVSMADTDILSRSLLDSWIQSMKDRDLSPNTIRVYARQIKSFFNWMLSSDIIDENPWDTFKPRYGTRTLKKDIFTEEEYETIKAKARGTVWYYAAIVAWNTGLRLVDVANLKFEDIDFIDQVITVTPRKTKRLGLKVSIPFRSGSDISKLLYYMDQNKDDDSGYVCPALQRLTHEQKGSYIAVIMFGSWLKNKVGIQGKTFHTFRRTFITRLLSNGADSEVVRTIVGISDRKTLDHYFVPNMRALKNAILKLGDYNEGS